MPWVTTKDGRRVNTDWFDKPDVSGIVDNGYGDDPVYTQTIKELSQLRKQDDEITHKWLEKEKELDKEVVKIPPLGFAESKALESFTEKGEKIYQEAKQLRKQVQEIEAQIKPLESIITRIESEHRNKELAKWQDENHQFSPRTRKQYEGFGDSTEIDGFDDAIAKGDARIVEMSPKEYMQRVSYEIFGSSMTRTMNGVNLETAKQYAQEMNAGSPAPIPYLDYDGLVAPNKGQEGRHRAIAAYLNGYDKIPVAVYKKHWN